MINFYNSSIFYNSSDCLLVQNAPTVWFNGMYAKNDITQRTGQCKNPRYPYYFNLAGGAYIWSYTWKPRHYETKYCWVMSQSFCEYSDEYLEECSLILHGPDGWKPWDHFLSHDSVHFLIDGVHKVVLVYISCCGKWSKC